MAEPNKEKCREIMDLFAKLDQTNKEKVISYGQGLADAFESMAAQPVSK